MGKKVLIALFALILVALLLSSSSRWLPLSLTRVPTAGCALPYRWLVTANRPSVALDTRAPAPPAPKAVSAKQSCPFNSSAGDCLSRPSNITLPPSPVVQTKWLGPPYQHPPAQTLPALLDRIPRAPIAEAELSSACRSSVHIPCAVVEWFRYRSVPDALPNGSRGRRIRPHWLSACWPCESGYCRRFMFPMTHGTRRI